MSVSMCKIYPLSGVTLFEEGFSVSTSLDIYIILVY